MRIFAAKDPRALAVVALAAALPRLVVLGVERGKILSAYAEKSDRFAETFVTSGTFGFIPDHPSAYTQPLYGFFLVPLYWVFGRTWLVVGLAQIVLAICTAFLVYGIARRVALRFAVAAAVAATLNPYLVWHDVHVNREITDQVVLAGLVLTTILTVERRSPAWGAATGALLGLAVLGNSRLAALPILVAAFFVWRLRRTAWQPIALALVAGALALTPWLVRNQVQLGCIAITTDARALWKANNLNTYKTLADGKWIDEVPQPRSFPLSPEFAADEWTENHVDVPVDECAQMRMFEHLTFRFWKKHPGEKAKLAQQAVGLLWDPRAHETVGRSGKGGWQDTARRIGEPVYMIPLYLLAIVGLFFAPVAFSVFALALLAYNTLAAMIFAGTTRYRVSFDFLLVLLAAAAVDRYRSATRSAAASAENADTAR